jgi:hypothetical protein
VSASNVFQTPTAEDVFAVKPQIDAALRYANGCYEFVDVLRGVLKGQYQMWRKGDSVILTEVIDYPRKRICLCFLAGGKAEEIHAMAPVIEAWAMTQGCVEGWLYGRKGWARAMKSYGWSADSSVSLVRVLGS